MILDRVSSPLGAQRQSVGFSALDSLEYLELLQEIESKYGVRLPDAHPFSTPSDLAAYIEARR
jgi:acyl carrier protein